VMESAGDAIETDSIVLIRGKVEHKERGATSLVAQQIEKFEPSAEEIAKAQARAAKPALAPTALRLHLDAASLPASVLVELKDLLAGFPGEADVVIELATASGRRRLKLGPSYRVARSAGLHAELDSLLGAALVLEPAVAAPRAVA
jgi:DNA polymerase III subunit alpha